MRFFRRTVTAALLVAIVSLTGFQTIAHAADPVESITLSPTSKKLHVDPGQILQDSLTVVNDGDTAYDFIVYASPYSMASGAYDKPSYTSTASNADAYTWFQFQQTSWHIEARQTLYVPYTVHVKKNAAPGGHYGVLFAEVQPAETTTDGTALIRKKRVGTVVYATVSGDVRLGGSMLGTSIPWFQSSAPLDITASVKNTGNTDFTATVLYQISDVFGSVKYSMQGEYAVLPSTTRDITLSWASAPWFGLYKARVTTTFLDTNDVRESYVLIMPIWLVLIVSTVVISGGIYAMWRHFSRSRH